jgi:RNA polymerase sigma-70 factor, ECF subfamily
MTAHPFHADASSQPAGGKPLRVRQQSPAPGAEDPQQRDLRLVEAHREGDARALGELLTLHQDRLYGICLRMVGDRELARDLTQDAMVKIIQGLHSYDGRARLTTWMIRVTMNTCLSELRKLRLRRHASLDASAGAGAEGEPGETFGARTDSLEPPTTVRVQESEDRDDVSHALARITPEQRAILILRDMQSLEYKAIGELLDIPGGTVKSRIFRARVALRERMEELRTQRARRP